MWIRGAFGAAWAAALGIGSLYVVALIIWAADSRSSASAGAALRLAGQLWLVAHRSPLRVDGGAIAIPPLVLTVGLGLMLARASSLVARASRCTEVRDLGPVIASVALPYAVIGGVLAGFSGSWTIHPSIGASVVCTGIVGTGFAGLGAVRGCGLGRGLWEWTPGAARVPLQAAGVAGAVLLGAAALLAAADVLVHLHRFTGVLDHYSGGPGKVSMLLLSVVLLPNTVLFALGYLLGPGFGLGTGTSVALGGAHLGALPALPLVATAPTGRAPLPVVAYCVVAVIAAGVVAGRRLACVEASDLATRARGVAITSAVLGVGVALALGFSGGPAGPGRLRAFGPSPWQTGLAAAAETAVVCAVVLAVYALRRRSGEPTIDLVAAEAQPDGEVSAS